jgi:hypothetical protein
MSLRADQDCILEISPVLGLARLGSALQSLQLTLKYHPSQPRVPAGSPEGGEWARGGAGTGKPGRDPEGISAIENRPRARALEEAGNHAMIHATDQSRGRCARSVREALASVGIVVVPPARRPGADAPWARDYGTPLEAAGFRKIADERQTILPTGRPVPTSYPPPGYVPRPGDVVVVQPYRGGSPFGHMAIRSSAGRVSDFLQRQGFWVSLTAERAGPSYIIYRYGSDPN